MSNEHTLAPIYTPTSAYFFLNLKFVFLNQSPVKYNTTNHMTPNLFVLSVEYPEKEENTVGISENSMTPTNI